MVELLRTNDMVLISYVRALLAAEKIEALDFDLHASVLDGSVLAIQRRVMVDDADERGARQLLTDAGLGDFLKR
jgi:hypothetical protein